MGQMPRVAWQGGDTPSISQVAHAPAKGPQSGLLGKRGHVSAEGVITIQAIVGDAHVRRRGNHRAKMTADDGMEVGFGRRRENFLIVKESLELVVWIIWEGNKRYNREYISLYLMPVVMVRGTSGRLCRRQSNNGSIYRVIR